MIMISSSWLCVYVISNTNVKKKGIENEIVVVLLSEVLAVIM